MSKPSLKTTLLAIGIFTIPLFGYFIWAYTVAPETLSDQTVNYAEAGKGVREDLELHPALGFTESDKAYVVEDTTTDGIQITFANTAAKPEDNPKLNLTFPKDYAEPIEVKLDDKRSVRITDLSGKKGYSAEPLQTETLTKENQGFFASLFKAKAKDAPKQYLRYASDDGRKSLLYAFQKDQATGEKKLKHWTLYQKGTGLETEEYKIENAKVRITDGKAEVFYFSDQDLKNEAATSEVDSNLLERAQRTIAKDMGEDILSGNQTPDFTIPAPYYLDRDGEKHDADWRWNEDAQTLSVSFAPQSYPVALDPTLSFTVPGQSNTGSVITGEGAGGYFGTSLAAGDFNADGRTDLAISTDGYGTIGQGRVYIFYNDGSITSSAGLADVKIDGVSTSDFFGRTLEAGDFNADGRTDLAVGSFHSTAYIFYNDGSYPITASSADVTITGSNEFSNDMAAGDFNADGRTDLAIGEYLYSSYTGRAYIFYNDGSIPISSATADVTITGNAANDVFGQTLVAGDFNADGKTDLAVSGYGYSSETGRIYLFYNDGSIPTTAATADVTITGDVAGRRFGRALAAGDFNADGRTDLAAGSPAGGGGAGYTFIFYNDGSIPTSPASADVTISNSTTHGYLGSQLAAGDMNGDGRTDLISSATDYTLYPGAVYVFYNDGSIPTDTLQADVTIEGESTAMLGGALVTGDFNTDGRTDLAVGGAAFASYTGRTYIFYSQNGQINTNQTITGGATGNYFGYALATGDLNADGRIDLAVGAPGYSSSTGRTYIFYGDGQIPSTTPSADVTITGGTAGDNFGAALATGDFNANGRVDLVVGANLYSTNSGRAYIFYNDGSIPTTAGTADVIISGESSSRFGQTLLSGDFNADGKTDLIASAPYYSGGNAAGRVYLFTADGTNNFGTATCSGTPALCAATDADAIMTGENNSDRFGSSLTAGDINTDGKVDLIAGAYSYSSNTGRVYAFYNGSITTESVTGADLTFTGESATTNFGQSVATGDLNADGRTDIAVGSDDYSTGSGRLYIFYNDGSYPSAAGSADVIITGSTTYLFFGANLQTGDFNADGRIDVVVGSHHYDAGAGKVFIFYNDGSYPSSSADADVTITGTAAADEFGVLSAGDMNGDGRIDLIVSASQYSTSTGQVYFYETRENFSWQIQRQFETTASTRTSLGGTGQELQINGEASSNFGYAMTSGDLNSDGKTDLIVGAQGYSTSIGRVYIFYADGSIANSAINADVVITGRSNAVNFGNALVTGDFNADGRVDLATSTWGYNVPNQMYIFYNDGSIPTTAAAADVIIAADDYANFATTLVAGDFNADGKTDVVAGSPLNNDRTGQIHVFYNDGAYPSLATSADAIITGQSTSTRLGGSLAVGDFNADGKTDIAAGASEYSGYTGRGYIFYSGAITTENASGADVIIDAPSSGDSFGVQAIAGDFDRDRDTDLAFASTTGGGAADGGEINIFYNDGSYPAAASSDDLTISSSTTGAYFGSTLAVGDVNNDGWTDIIAAGDETLNSAYIFYNDGSIPTAQSSADVIISGENASDYFGRSFASGDFSGDGKIDLAVGADLYASNKGKVYLYTFNDPVITGGATGDQFGIALATGDLNADGKTDLVVGANGYSSSTGRAYIFYNDGTQTSSASSADVTITGNAAGDGFGGSFGVGDFNADGTTDLAVGASSYSTSTGRAYIFYNDGSIPTTAATADVTITGEATNNSFGSLLAAGDLNADGEMDLIATAPGYSSTTGRAYIFYNDGSIPTTAATADVAITGDVPAAFGDALTTGDFNSDGKTDLVVAMSGYFGYGRLYFFYADGTNNFGTASCTGSSPTVCLATNADQLIIGTANSDSFGYRVIAGDFNTDGRMDLAATALNYDSASGRVYIIYNDGSYPSDTGSADVTITGANLGSAHLFGTGLTSGDLNADGRTDLVVGAYGTPADTYTGHVYVYYNDGSWPTTSGTADLTLTGEAPSRFGSVVATGDLNADGKSDVVVGGYTYSSSTGRVYLFTSEAAPASVLPGTASLKGNGSLKGNVRWK